MLHPIFPRQAVHGWDGSDGDIPLYPADTVESALVRAHDSDAHSACYAVYDQHGKPMTEQPRLMVKGNALRSLRSDGGEVYMRFVAVDCDRSPHEPWPTEYDPEDTWGNAASAVAEVAKQLPHTVVYATRGGLRVIYRLQQLVSPEGFRKVASIAMREVSKILKTARAPLDVDETCNQWSRLFRLPMVLRDGVRTDDACHMIVPSPWVSWFPGYDELQAVEDIAKVAAAGDVADMPAELPLDVDLRALVAEMGTRGPLHFRKMALSVAAGRAFFDSGERNSTTFKLVHAVVDYALARGRSVTATGLMSVFRESVSHSSGTPVPQALGETWSIISRAVARADALRTYYAKQAADAFEAVQDRNPIIVYTNKSRWVYDPMRRSYGEATSNDQTLLAELGRLHPTEILNDEGKAMPLHIILRQSGVRVKSVRMLLGLRGSRVRREGDHHVLEVGVGSLVDVPPKYHDDVAEYLSIIHKHSEDGESFMQWLACCNRLDQPITSLLLHGASGSGKNMIAEALGYIFGGKADFKKTMGQFNAVMLSTGLIHLDEGMDDEGGKGGVANRFREVVGGETISIELKGIDPMEVRGNYRLITTANNPRPLPVSNTKSLDDFRAIASRVVHVYMPDAAKQWLEGRGGRSYTEDWVRRDLGGQTIPGKLTEHIAWLQHNYPVPEFKSRFLVPARISEWHVQALLQGILRDVLTTVAYGVGYNVTTPAIHVANGKIYMSADQQAAAFVKKQAIYGEYESHEITNTIKNALRVGEPLRHVAPNGNAIVYYEMPLDLLMAIAKPDRPDIYVEEAQAYVNMLKRVEASR